MTVTEAIRHMRLLRQSGQDFGLLFARASAPFGIRKVERCQLRTRPIDADGDKQAGKQKQFAMTDRFLYFTDLDTGESKQCRKRLILKMRIDTVWYDVTLD